MPEIVENAFRNMLIGPGKLSGILRNGHLVPSHSLSFNPSTGKIHTRAGKCLRESVRCVHVLDLFLLPLEGSFSRSIVSVIFPFYFVRYVTYSDLSLSG